LRIPEFSEQLHVPAKTIERWIKKLRDKNRIVFKGAPKTGGYSLAGGD
jgi:ATP-dependent DNA helicase RecG